MDNFKISSRVFSTRYFKSESTQDKLALVLPGAGYTCSMPLLYYSIKVLIAKGYSVLAIESVYSSFSDWMNLPSGEAALEAVEKDAPSFFKTIEEQMGKKIDTVLARSLGTYLLACGLETGSVSPQQIIWQSPSLPDKWKVMKTCKIRSFAIIGTADDRFESAKPFLPEDCLVIENANHGLEIDKNIEESLESLRRVTFATQEWVVPA